MKKLLLIILIITGSLCHGLSQNTDDTVSNDRDKALNIFLDCLSCDVAYFKTNFTLVNYVNERTDADVHILVTSMATGGGGTEYTMLLNGRKRFSMHRDTAVFSVPADATQDIRRATMLEHTKLGLVPFLMKTPARKKLTLLIDELSEDDASFNIKDPWRNWNFEISAGGSIMNEKTSKSYGIHGGLYVTKVTPEIKLESSNSFRLNEAKLNLYDGDSLIFSSFSSQSSFSSYNLFAKSLGDHFSLGGLASFLRSDYSNLDMQLVVGPMVEFNLFKYADASHKQFRFLYGITYEYSDYMDLTIHNKLSEQRFINLGKGFSFNIGGDFSYIQNQIGLKQGTASTEELMLGQRELETNYRYNISFGITFRFGSKNNNVVNPRIW